MIGLSIIVSIQTLAILWLIGRNQIHEYFIIKTGKLVNYHSDIFIDLAIKNAIDSENYELAHELKKKRDGSN